MITDFFPGIYSIEVPLPNNPLKMLNAYLIRGKERHLLIDTGFNRPECFSALTEALQKLHISRDKLDIFITHLHADNCGLAADLPEGTDTRLYCSAKDTIALNNTTRGAAFWDIFLHRMHPHGITEEYITELGHTHPARRFCPSHEISTTHVKEGDTLHYGDYTLHVLDTPGHTPGHVALYIPSSKTLFSGDLILGNITPNISSWEGEIDSLGTYLKNLSRINDMGVALTLPGHRSVIENTNKRISELQQHHAARLNEVRAIMQKGEATAYQVAGLMTWDMRYNSWDDFPVAQKWFATCEALAHIDHLEHMGELSRTQRRGRTLFAVAKTK